MEADQIAAVRNGDVVATEAFVRTHAAWMLTVAKRILRDRARSEDAVQDAFINIFNGLDKFDGRAKITTWMHRIVINQALMVLRKHNRANETSIDDLLPEFDEGSCRIEDSWSAPSETPEAHLLRSDIRKKTSEQIDKLPDNYRSVLILRDIEGLSTAEVGELLGLSDVNVKVRLHRARSALKKPLEPLMREQAL